MNRRTGGLSALLLSLCLAAPGMARAQTPAQTPAQIEAGLQAIGALAQVNGQALACQDMPAVGRAKALMLAHAPKTARYRIAFEDGTQQAYLAQTRAEAAPCPDAAATSARLDAVSRQLQSSLPAPAGSP